MGGRGKKKTARRRSWSAALGGIQRGDEETLDFLSQREEGIKIVFYQVGAFQQSEPVNALTRFLQCNMQLRDKISFAVSVDCLINVGTDGGGRAKKLFGDGGVFFALENTS